MVKAEVRETPKGNWWCNTTFNGYDYSVEAETITDAEVKLAAEIRSLGYKGEFMYGAPVYQPKKVNVPSSKYYVGAMPFRIDHNPFG